MNSKIINTIIFVFIFNGLSAQEKQFSSGLPVSEKSISFEMASLSFTYAHKLNKNVIIGASVHFGMALLVQINVLNGYSSGIIAPRFEMSKFRIFYRKHFTRKLYSDMGGYISWGYYPDSFPAGDFILFTPTEHTYGLFVSVFYGSKKIKLGQELQLGFVSEKYYGIEKNKAILLFTPIVVRYSF